MMHRRCKTVFPCFLIIFALMKQATGHSFLLAPKPDWTNYAQPECRRGGTDGAVQENCYGPCGTAQYFFDPNQQATTVTRGQVLNMQWGKNNHFNGFVRFTLVPKSQRMDFGSHDKFAFRYACWEAGSTPCSPGEYCGTDLQGIKYTADVQIPSVYPDGDYVLGWSWYGGTRYYNNEEMQKNGISAQPGHRSEYGDYYSCANIKIQGGAPVESQYTPVFYPAQAGRDGTCASAVSALGVCPVEPCTPKYPVADMVPEPFNGKSPSPILSTDLGYSSNAGGQNAGPSQTASPTTPASTSASGAPPSVDITRYTFINTDDQSEIYSVGSDSTSVRLNAAKFTQKLSIRADATGSIASVRFLAQLSNDKRTLSDHTEYQPPYFIKGDENGNGIANPWQEAAQDNMMSILVTVTGTDGGQKTKELSLYLDSSA
jgi:hypothetical protein